MIPKTIIHLLSGGLDSVTLLYDLHQQGHNIHCLLFDYHQRHVQELAWAKHHCQHLEVLFTTLELPDLHGLTEPNWVVPFRNGIMLSLAVNVAVQAKADTITFAANAGDALDFPDCGKDFLEAMNAAVKASGYAVEVCAPYIEKPKRWIADKARQMRIPLHEIWTCYKGGIKPCGKCPACEKLKAATA